MEDGAEDKSKDYNETSNYVGLRKESVSSKGEELCVEGGYDVTSAVCARLELQNYGRRENIFMLRSDVVQIQNRLGSGSFSVVFSANLCIDLPENPMCTADSLIEDSCTGTANDSFSVSMGRDTQQEHSKRNFFGNSKSSSFPYAMKRLRTDVLASNNVFQRIVAVRDFLLEVELLTRLPAHPNIIQIFALSESFFSNPGRGFIILERLEQTLEQRLAQWEKQQFEKQQRLSTAATSANKNSIRRHPRPKTNRSKTFLVGLFSKSSSSVEVRQQQQEQRLIVYGLGICHAIEHLHRHKIIFRDLKPANIGITPQGSVRIFDFGLARSCQSFCGEGKLLTGGTGTLRFMAPEVALHLNYGLAADIYSLGLILWQICSLVRPFGKLDQREEFVEKVVRRHLRPSLRPVIVADHRISQLITSCWSPIPQSRPNASQVISLLQTSLLIQPKTQRIEKDNHPG